MNQKFPKVRFAGAEMVCASALKGHPKNRNHHSKEQVERLAKILEYQGFRYPIKVSKQSGFITSGHGRLLAAEFAGYTHVPVSYQDYDDEAQEYLDVQADNAIALWAELDYSGINSDIPDFGPDFDIDLLGIQDFTLDPNEKLDSDELSDDLYTKKIESPIYKPSGPMPAITELFDLSKTHELIEQIEAIKLPNDLKKFLIYAAYRHIVFNYETIANYYAHSSAEVKELMENSALVIIDFDKAIEHGFVTLTKEIAEVYKNDDL